MKLSINKGVILLLLCMLIYPYVHAQVYQTLTHTSGTQQYGSYSVTVVPVNNPTTTTNCNTGPYYIGQSSACGYKYVFSKPVSNVRLHIVAGNSTTSGAGEEISFQINGNNYSLLQSQNSLYPGTCNNVDSFQVVNGNLKVVNAGICNVSSVASTLDITPGYGIDTFRIYHLNAICYGSVYSFEFLANDTSAFISQAFADTSLCAGDTIRVPYLVTNKFLTNNMFKIQLSNASGSFSNPITIGTLNSDTADTITCVIPTTIQQGSAYRIRITSSAPSKVFSDNGKDIIINKYPASFTASTNSPVCSGETLLFSASSSTTGISYHWTGPNSFSTSFPNPVIAGVLVSYAGTYIVAAGSGNCIVSDTFNVVINQSPQGLNATSNSSICSGDTLKLFSGNVSSGSTLNWTGPNSYTSASKDPVIVNAGINHSGTYIVKATLNGCSETDTVNASVKPLPQKPNIVSNSPVCSGKILQFSATISSTGITYNWTGPNNFSSTASAPSIPNTALSDSGSYYLTITLNGCGTSDTEIVKIKESPAPVTASSNSAICEKDTLKLFASCATSGVSYSWSGPGSYTSLVQNPLIVSSIPSASGSYITEASINGCATNDTITVQVKPLPVAFFDSTNSPLCSGEYIQFNAGSTSTGVSYQWTGPNGFSSNQPNTLINNATSAHNGSYYIIATLNGCNIRDTQLVTVKPLPVKPVASSNAPVCAEDTLKLSASTMTSNTTFSWDGPGGFSSSAKDTLIANTSVNMSGDYIVSVEWNGCSNKDTISCTIKPRPAPVQVTSNSPICHGDTLLLFAGTSTSGVTYSWTGPGNFASSQQNAVLYNASPSSSGIYKATLDLNGCSWEDAVSVTVNPIPPAPSLSYNFPLCSGEQLELTASNITNANYNWTGPGNFSSTLQNPVRANISFNDTGTYFADVTVKGCTSSKADIKVLINNLPFVVIFPAKDTICQGEQISFSALPNNAGGTPAYAWYVNGIPSGAGQIFTTNMINDSDIVRCDMTEYTKCTVPYKDASNDVMMSVLPWETPSATITSNPSGPVKAGEYITFTAHTIHEGKNPLFQWKKNGQNIVGATGDKWSANTLNDNDKISVVMYSDYQCPIPKDTFSNEIVAKILVGISDQNKKEHIQLYPNPNDGTFYLSGYFGKVEYGYITVYNLLGEEVYRTYIHHNGGVLLKKIQLPSVPTGSYLIKVNFDTTVVFKKLVIAR